MSGVDQSLLQFLVHCCCLGRLWVPESPIKVHHGGTVGWGNWDGRDGRGIGNSRGSVSSGYYRDGGVSVNCRDGRTSEDGRSSGYWSNGGYRVLETVPASQAATALLSGNNPEIAPTLLPAPANLSAGQHMCSRC